MEIMICASVRVSCVEEIKTTLSLSRRREREREKRNRREGSSLIRWNIISMSARTSVIFLSGKYQSVVGLRVKERLAISLRK